MMWMMPLHLHVTKKKSDYDDDDDLMKRSLYHIGENVWYYVKFPCRLIICTTRLV